MPSSSSARRSPRRCSARDPSGLEDSERAHRRELLEAWTDPVPRTGPLGSEHRGARECARQRYYLRRGSSASRRPSPKRLKPSTVKKMASPGKSESHGLAWMNAMLALRSHPQLGVGGWVPSPRNESVASTMMEVA